MKLNFISNKICDNKALNGGGIFMKDNNTSIQSNNNTFIIENNNFINNIALNEGGAIYSDYSKFDLAQPKNNSINFNKAGINGGGIYSLYSNDKNFFNDKYFNIYGNTVEKHISNIGSKPSYITISNSTSHFFNITSGDQIKLEFILYDQFDNILEDYSKIYSSLPLKVILIDESEENNIEEEEEEEETLNENNSYKLYENVGSFVNGK